MPQRKRLDQRTQAALVRLARTLIDQKQARVLVRPQQNTSGAWFGGGNIILDADGAVLLVGRYRNPGDSRTGLTAGERGRELAVFRADRFEAPFQKVRHFTKADLASPNKPVLSIEGTALHRTTRGIELFVSSEKDVPYPNALSDFQKPGTGLWTIDVFTASNLDALDPSSITEVISATTPATLHVKDPVIFDRPDGATVMLYCTHPYTWASSNTAAAIRPPGATDFEPLDGFILERGPVWDIAVTRITDRLSLPSIGLLADLPRLSLYFYDGAECVRPHEQHGKAVARPRGYSCEEIGGLAWGWDDAFPIIERLSVDAPLFTSPHGTGSSRYVHTLLTDQAICAAWQQSQPDRSQPLVGHTLRIEEVNRILDD